MIIQTCSHFRGTYSWVLQGILFPPVASKCQRTCRMYEYLLQSTRANVTKWVLESNSDRINKRDRKMRYTSNCVTQPALSREQCQTNCFTPTLGGWSVAISSSVVTGNIVFKAATPIPLPKGLLSQINTGDDLVTEETSRANRSN